jgi:hypothetical protein
LAESTFLELLASYEAALDAAQRSITITRKLAEGLLSGQHPPDDVIREYAAQAAEDEERLAELRGRMALFRAMSRTH